MIINENEFVRFKFENGLLEVKAKKDNADDKKIIVNLFPPS